MMYAAQQTETNTQTNPPPHPQGQPSTPKMETAGTLKTPASIHQATCHCTLEGHQSNIHYHENFNFLYMSNWYSI